MAGSKIWLLQTWEPNPVDDPNARPWRTGMLARRLVAAGHDVTWWASYFSHNTKRFRAQRPDASFEIDERFTIRLIPALGYSRHVSLARLKDHAFVARSWKELAEQAEKPDVIVASYPTIELCVEAARFAKKFDIPLLIDIRDQYPDLYWENAPKRMQKIVRLLTSRSQRAAREALSAANAITANGPEVVAWGLRYAGREAMENDIPVFMSYEPPSLSPEEEETAERYWADLGLDAATKEMIVAYTGMIGQTIELGPVIQAAKALPHVKFVLCGGGDGLALAKREAQGLQNVIFTGWLKSPEVQQILRLASIGIVPYRDRGNFETGITNKPVEYLANGLPIVTSLQRGILVDLLKQGECGVSYRNTNPEELIAALATWSKDPMKLAEASTQARGLFDSTFHPDKVYEKWVGLIERVALDRP